ncbi:Uncharacterised protein [Burkholderia pseudomallei]|nr:Uncharacterised protein [Burkholderia pseudomallei]CAJ3183194.1 Uncharacterised protein [Burkholderia pseudomallei]CAJ3416114.1 Uncharacterised protein [Burkholderia pseudomallei]CAJ3882507.1 Uncharacterised protein [Burkholderia pseudomallei]CAJ3928644.1 Uncharacterised protein [Burkholderia pseudomallei]
MRCALCEEGGIGISIFGAENACCPNRHGPNARLTNGCIRTGASQTGMSRTARPERRDPNGETRTARPERRDPNGETRMGRIPAGLGAVVLVMRAFSRRRARIVRAFGLLARCVARRRFRAVVGARAPRVPDRIVIRVIALLLAPQKKFVTARSRCRRNRCVVRLWKEAGRGSASAGTSTDETIRCLNGARRCSVGAKRENHSRAVQSAFQAAFSAMLKTAARPLK